MLVTDATGSEIWLTGKGYCLNVYRFADGRWTVFCEVCGLWHACKPTDPNRRRATTLDDWHSVALWHPLDKYKHLWRYCPKQFKEQLHASNRQV